MDVKAQRVSMVRFMDTIPDIHMIMFGSHYMDYLPEVACDGFGCAGGRARASQEAAGRAMRGVAVIASRPVGLVAQVMAATRDLREEKRNPSSWL